MTNDDDFKRNLNSENFLNFQKKFFFKYSALVRRITHTQF